MRFVIAIAAFVVAAAMIVLGIAQRTVFLPPSSISLEATVKDDLPYIVIDGAVLNTMASQQAVTVTGKGDVFVAYGRTADVTAWLGDESYSSIGLNKDKSALKSSVVKGKSGADEPDDKPSTTAPSTQAPSTKQPSTPTTTPPADDSKNDEKANESDSVKNPGPNPQGSDLWLQEFAEKDAVIASMSVPDDVSVIIAADGTKPAPAKVLLTWPADTSTPFAGPLIVGGILLLIIGLALYLLGINHLRKSRGPRRKGITTGEKSSRFRRPKGPNAITAPQQKQLGRSSRRALVPVLLVSSLALSGCSANFWPDFSQGAPAATPTPTSTALPDEATEAKPPVVSVSQLEKIVARIATVAADADAAKDAKLAATRFAGPALAERTTNYQIRGKLPKYAAPAAIPSSPVTLTVPQATDTWPRMVMTVIQDKDDSTIAPTTLVLTQASPRDNYMIEYAVRLDAAATISGAPPATIGAAKHLPDSEFLAMPPSKVAGAYADLLTKGEKSEFAPMFDLEGDTLIAGILADRAKKVKGVPKTATISFSAAAGVGTPLALTTIDSGAILAVSMDEVETVKPAQAGVLVKPSGAVAALIGLKETAKGTSATYSDQLLFYVPPANSDGKIVLLGFSQGLTKASELK